MDENNHFLATASFSRNLWRLPMDILENGFSYDVAHPDYGERERFMAKIHEMRSYMGEHCNTFIQRMIDCPDFVYTAAINRYGESLFITEDWESEPELFQDWQVREREKNLERELQHLKNRLEKLTKKPCSSVNFPPAWTDLYDKTVRELWLEDSDVTIVGAYLQDGQMIIRVMASDPVLQGILDTTTEFAAVESATVCAYCGSASHMVSDEGYPVCKDCHN